MEPAWTLADIIRTDRVVVVATGQVGSVAAVDEESALVILDNGLEQAFCLCELRLAPQ